MSDLFGIGTAVSGLLGTAGSIWNNERNISAQRDMNDAQLELARENLAYQKAFNEQVFAREDTELQRRKDDAIAAGYSPLAALGTGGGSAAVVSAPQQQITGTAPQGKLDLGGIADIIKGVSSARDAYTNARNADTESRRVTDLKTFNDSMTALRAKDLTEQQERFLKQLEESARQFDDNLKQEKDLAEATNKLKRSLSELQMSYQDEWTKDQLKQAQKELDEQAREYNKGHFQKTWQFWVGKTFDLLTAVGSSVVSQLPLAQLFGKKAPIGFGH